MRTRIASCLTLSLPLVLVACQAISNQSKPEQESVAEINTRSSELEDAADAAVNRQISDIMADAEPALNEAVHKTAR